MRKLFKLLGASALAVGAGLVLPSAAEARPWGAGGYAGSGYYGGYSYGGYGYNNYRPYGYSNGFYGYNYYNASPYYSGNYDYQAPANFYGVAAPVANSYQSFYSGPSVDASAAILDIQVPGDASIWIGNSTTEQRGMNRSFISPPLESGKTYAYDIKAQWTQNGKQMEEQKRVQIRAGDRVRVDFLNASLSGSAVKGTGAVRKEPNAAVVPPAIRNDGTGARGYDPANPDSGNVRVAPSTPVTAGPNTTVIGGVPLNPQPAGVVAPGAAANRPAGPNASNMPPAGTVNPNQLPPAGQNNPPTGPNTPNPVPGSDNNPNPPTGRQVDTTSPIVPVPGQTAPSPSIVPR